MPDHLHNGPSDSEPMTRDEALYLLYIAADALLLALAFSPARSGQINVSSLRPSVEGLAEAVAHAKPHFPGA